MSVLETLVRDEMATFSLETARVVGLVIVAPLPWVNTPTRVRAAIALMLAVVAHGQVDVPARVIQTVPMWFIATACEFLVGAAIGFVVRLAISVAEIAASVLAPHIGFGAAQLLNPATQSTETVLGTLFRTFAILFAILAGMHHVFIGGLLASFRAIPVGSMPDVTLAVPVLLSLSADALATGVRLAIPVLAVLFMTQIALAFVSRAAPAMQIFSIGFAITLAVGTTVLIFAAPDISRELLVEVSRVGPRIELVLVAMRGS